MSSSDSTFLLDPLPTPLLKSCSDILSTSLSSLINLSLADGIFPDSFKHAVVSPLLKKPNLPHDSLSNYHPISNLSFISKLLERVVFSRLLTHISSFSTFSSFQSAYRRFHSTETALLRIHNDLLHAMDSKKFTALVLLDLSAAFDTIDHSILLHRLNTWFGISSTALNFISSYLSNRTQTVLINSFSSPTASVPIGVPQGSVLGPLLFTLHTTPLFRLLHQQSLPFHLYADDTQIYLSFSAPDSTTALNNISLSLTTVHSWFTANMLSINPSKTEFLLIGTPQQRKRVLNPTITFEGSQITASSSTRNLDVIFDASLLFHDHISSICKSSFFLIRMLRNIRHCLDLHSATILANSLVTSKLDYCNSLLYGLPKSSIQRLQRVQNSLARVVIPSTRRSDHITPVLK